MATGCMSPRRLWHRRHRAGRATTSASNCDRLLASRKARAAFPFPPAKRRVCTRSANARMRAIPYLGGEGV